MDKVASFANIPLKVRLNRIIQIIICLVLLFLVSGVIKSAQAQTAKSKGQVKAINVVTIPAEAAGGVRRTCGILLTTHTTGCLYYDLSPEVSPSVPIFDFNFRTFTATAIHFAWAKFDLSSLPANEQILGAKLEYTIQSCQNSGDMIHKAFGNTGQADPVSFPAISKWSTIHGGTTGYGSGNLGTCTGTKTFDLTGTVKNDLFNAKSAVNKFSIGLSSSIVRTTLVPNSFKLIVTYGTPDVDIKVNGSNGPLDVSSGDTLNVSWSSTGWDSCKLMTNPVLWTPTFQIGKRLPGTGTGTATSKAYRAVTITTTGLIFYQIQCVSYNDPTDIHSGIKNIGGDGVEVKVAP